ncbi:MAG: NAD(P)H-dependent oxidoreductase [Desulfomonile tiedjei]|nr:NAD(P)H-dependent oxidoreductase [Desulfomonile tiedjei]
MKNESLAKERALPNPTKAQQILLYSAPFPPLAFFKIWASVGRDPGSLLAAAGAMLIYCVIVLVLASRWDKPTYFDWAVSAYFLVITASLALWPGTAGAILTEYAVTGIYLCMFSVAFFPLILGFEPFTYHYAKKTAPQMVWGTPIFANINRIMTLVWAGIFAVCVVLSLYPSVVTRALIPITVILAVGMPFNIRFPDYYLKRMGLPGLAGMRKLAQSSSGGAAIVSGTGAVSNAIRAGVELPAAKPAPAGTSRDKESSNFTQRQEEAPMKVIALNSSPRGDGTSKTGIMLDALVKGMSDAGAEVETVQLRHKKVKNCIGCFTCWTKTPGVCIHKDDMANELFPKWLAADLVIYATPLYHYTVNATMKAFIERTLPVVEPFFQRSNDKTSHPLRQTPPRSVVLSVAGFPEASVFAQLSSYVTFLFREGLVAEIYRPAAEMLTLPGVAETAGQVLEATMQAGKELVASTKISQATMERIAQPIVTDFDSFAKMGNAFWKTCIQEGLTPAEFNQKGLTPRPDSLETFMVIMPSGFNPEGAGDTRAVIQFNFSGSVDGVCYFKIEDGKIEAKAGPAEKPDLTIDSPFDVWMDIMTGKADGQQMFMQQKYKTSGDLMLLMRLKDLFGKAKK